MSEKNHNIRQRILDIAKEEFLTHGFTKASMRAIAGKVGVTATALYRHFADKEQLFSALIEPVWQDFLKNLAVHDITTFQLSISEHPEGLWDLSEQEFSNALAYVYDHFDVFKLMLCCSSGTRYSRFQHELVEREVDTMQLMITLMREQGHQVNQVDSRSLHLLLSGFFTSLFEMIIHDYSREEAQRHIKVLSVYFSNGLRAVLGM